MEGSNRSRTLVVDDDQVVRELLLALLDLQGHDAHVVDSGEAALHWLAQSASPDLILTDMQLPGLNGAELIEALRSYAPASTRLVGMSGSRPRQQIFENLDAFVMKPFGFAELEEVLQELHTTPHEAMPGKATPGEAPLAEKPGPVLRLRDEASPADLPGDAAGTAERAPAPVLDEGIFQALRQTFRSKQLAELYTLTLTDVALRRERVAAFAAEGNLPAMQAEAHSIKGLCGMVGARELGALAAAIERSTTVDTAATSEIEAACARLRRMLDTKFVNPSAPAGEHE